MDVFGGVLFGRALAIAVRRGVFEQLGKNAATAEEIARQTGLHATGVTLLLDAFSVCGYLNRDRSRYRLTAEGRTWLLQRSPSYIGNLIAYMETLHRRWQSLEYSLEHGTPPKPYYAAFTADDWRVYVNGMRDLARLMEGEVLRRVNIDGSARTVLDVGGSHAHYALALCRRHPGLHATVIDLEGALQHTREIIESEGMQGWVHLVTGDITTCPFPGEQDAVLMFNLIHGFDAPTNRMLVEKALHALKPGGQLFILDQLRPSGHGSQLSRFMPLMVGLNLLNEIGGTVYAFEEVREWCGSARVRRIPLRMPGVSLVVVGSVRAEATGH